MKLKEGKTSVLEGVPESLPALVKASRIQDKVAGVGFDWEQPEQVWEKVEEELTEFKAEVINKDEVAMENEFGDVLFSLINYARFLKINPENALEKTNKKYWSVNKLRSTNLDGLSESCVPKLEDSNNIKRFFPMFSQNFRFFRFSQKYFLRDFFRFEKKKSNFFYSNPKFCQESKNHT